MHALLLLTDLVLGLLHAVGSLLEALSWLVEPWEAILWLAGRCGRGRAGAGRATRQPRPMGRRARGVISREHRRRRRRAACWLRAAS